MFFTQSPQRNPGILASKKTTDVGLLLPPVDDLCQRSKVEKKKVLEKLKSQTKQRTSDRGSTGQCLCPVMSNHYGVETLNKNENVTKIS